MAATAPPIPPVKVALAQMRCVDSDAEGNFARIRAAAEAAATHEARAVFYPETADLGWVNPEAHTLAGPVPGPFTDRVAALAREFGLWIGIGLSERAEGALYDTAVLIDPRGAIVLRHRKINLLAWLMEPPYAAGDSAAIDVAETPFGRVGMLVCADSFERTLLEALARRRPDLVYIPYGWAAPKGAWPEHGFELLKTVQRAARVLEAPVLGPNCVGEITHGEWCGRTYEGLSAAADRTGLSLVQGKWNREELIVLAVEPGRGGAGN
ncbi:MAG TPA: carbon-nitrogen hydrolase family protein [Planctomycetes bacterium]|nr:carbon-nitrogen hydrolase family protein [Planctomycetota bacterium]